MQFEYEINPDDYVSAAILYAELSNNFRKMSGWMFGGVVLLVVALLERDRGLSPVLLGAIGVWWICAGVTRTFPRLFLRRYYRRYYQRLGMQDKKYRASIGEDGVQVDGDEASWRMHWQNISPKGENSDLFLFCARGTMLIFAKRYLMEEHQQQLRTWAGL